MSLVAYGSSDESSDEEVKPDVSDVQNNPKKEVENSSSIVKTSTIHMSLPIPKNRKNFVENEEEKSVDGDVVIGNGILGFGALPRPKSLKNDQCITEDDDFPLFPTKQHIVVDKPMKKDKIPAKISIPSLSEFKDVDEDLEKRKDKPTASKMGTGLFAKLPPPRSEILTKKPALIPHVLTKSTSNEVTPSTKVPIKNITGTGKIHEKKKILPVIDYESNSEDDDDNQDFFSLSKPTIQPEIALPVSTDISTITESKKIEHPIVEMHEMKVDDPEITANVETPEIPINSTLVSTVMNLPREEILLKNKAEVGPKLPVPEQEFNVDSEGNVAFDDKAIEYLCGKRGVKRKNQMIDEANIIEINGEDIKPDEREWLVKALTEEPVQRPVSMQGAGPSSQSKKKHQITYLAHQAKAMEVELKNTWSQNRMARKQTQSKYGF